MKKSIKLISLFIMSLAMIMTGKEKVFAADNAPATFTASTYAMNPKPLGLTNNISVKKTSTGKYIYCYDVNANLPIPSIVYTKNETITNAAMASIIASGANDKTDNDFFATQAALWIYLLDNGMMRDTEYNYINNIKKAINGNYANDPIAKDIKNILAAAQSAKLNEPVLKINRNLIHFISFNGEYESNVIVVNSSSGNYQITSSNAPKGTEFIKKSNGFIIKIPDKSLAAGTTTFDVKVSSTESKANVYRYKPSNSSYQDMLAVYTENVNLSDSISVSVTKEAPKPVEPDNTTIVIEKRDSETNLLLSGASLVLKDSNGKTVYSFVSSNKAEVITNLDIGTYTLEETKAPSGYVKTTQKIKVVVKADGKTATYTMYNTPVKPVPVEPDNTTVIIEKRDSETNLFVSGATLVLKDSNGKTVYTLVTKGRADVITGLDVGTYTLEETKAPSGYIKTTEKIKIVVRADGKTVTYTMYNTPKEEPEPEEPTIVIVNKKDAITNEFLKGATLVIRDSKGNIVKKWVTDGKSYEIKDLAVGTYTLEEIEAPKGYVLSPTKLKIVVALDGKTETYTIYNSPEKVEETVVSISKRDITNDQELEGATLIVRDANGKELYKWVSGKEPYIIKGLAEGTYTLEEIYAPEGYQLSSEKITFEVKNNGVVTEVIMYNTPEATQIVEIPSTGSFASNMAYIIGGIVIIIGSVLIYRNAKKEQ